MRHTKAIIVGVFDVTFVLIQKKDGEREICPACELYLEEESFDIRGLSPEDIGKLIPEDTYVEDKSNDFDRFKKRLELRIEEQILMERRSG